MPDRAVHTRLQRKPRARQDAATLHLDCLFFCYHWSGSQGLPYLSITVGSLLPIQAHVCPSKHTYDSLLLWGLSAYKDVQCTTWTHEPTVHHTGFSKTYGPAKFAFFQEILMEYSHYRHHTEVHSGHLSLLLSSWNIRWGRIKVIMTHLCNG